MLYAVNSLYNISASLSYEITSKKQKPPKFWGPTKTPYGLVL